LSNLFLTALTSFLDVPHSHFDNYSAQQSLLNPGNNSRLFQLLAMTVVCYEDAFQDLMSDDPKERWTDDSGSVHPFLVKVEVAEAYNFAGVSSEMRIQWRKEVKEQWVSYNFNGLPINEVRHNYASVMIDSRSLLTVVNNVAQHQQHSNH